MRWWYSVRSWPKSCFRCRTASRGRLQGIFWKLSVSRNKRLNCIWSGFRLVGLEQKRWYSGQTKKKNYLLLFNPLWAPGGSTRVWFEGFLMDFDIFVLEDVGLFLDQAIYSFSRFFLNGLTRGFRIRGPFWTNISKFTPNWWNYSYLYIYIYISPFRGVYPYINLKKS